MNKQTTAFIDVVIIIITLFSVQVTWMLLQTNIEPMFNAAGNFTQTSVTTKIPGSNLTYIFPALLIIGAFLNVRRARYKMAFVAAVGMVSMVYNHMA